MTTKRDLKTVAFLFVDAPIFSVDALRPALSNLLMRRGTDLNINNRFEAITIEPFDDGWGELRDDGAVPTVFYDDKTKSVLSKNTSPDLPFTYSVNPYRGCEHGCVYCYARPSHEYLGFSSAQDFESKIMVKRNVARLLEEEFLSPSWKPEHIFFSGNTDCYQPVEARLQLTRACLDVCLRFRNPVSIVTKNFMVTRDIDILTKMAKLDLVSVTLSVTTLDADLARTLEPRTSTPMRRLEAVKRLSEAGIHTGVLLAPIIPGLNDREIPGILNEAAAHGAQWAGMEMLRLPLSVEPIFVDWLERHRPLAKERVIAHIKDIRGGKMYESDWNVRMTGRGAQADAIRNMFRVSAERAGLNKSHIALRTDLFRRDAQLDLFGR